MPTGGRIVQPHVASSVGDDAVDTDALEDNAVTLAKMAGLARGKIIYGDASGDPAALAIGSDNYILTVDGSDIGWEAAAAGGISTTLADGNILVGNDSNVATSVNPSGDVDVTNAGVFSIASGVVVDADVNGSAAISISKTALVAGTNITLSTNTLAVDDAFIKNDANDTTTGIITSAGLAVTDSQFAQFSSTAGTPGTDNSVQGIVIEFLALEAITQFDAVYVSTTTGRVGRANAAAVTVKTPSASGQYKGTPTVMAPPKPSSSLYTPCVRTLTELPALPCASIAIPIAGTLTVPAAALARPTLPVVVLTYTASNWVIASNAKNSMTIP